MTKQAEIREGIAQTIRLTIRKSTFESAGEIVKYLHSKGVAIKVERELPEYCRGCMVTDELLKAGYVAVEPLIGKK